MSRPYSSSISQDQLLSTICFLKGLWILDFYPEAKKQLNCLFMGVVERKDESNEEFKFLSLSLILSTSENNLIVI